MKCGVSLKTRAISAGSGMLLIMKRVMCWRMSLATEKMSFSSSLKGFWNLSAFNIITRMIGGLMNSSYLNRTYNQQKQHSEDRKKTPDFTHSHQAAGKKNNLLFQTGKTA